MGWAYCHGCGVNLLAGQVCTCMTPQVYEMTKDELPPKRPTTEIELESHEEVDIFQHWWKTTGSDKFDEYVDYRRDRAAALRGKG